MLLSQSRLANTLPRHLVLLAALLLLSCGVPTSAAEGPTAAKKPAAARTEGFYKDLFMDGGVSLTSRKRLPAAESLGLTYELYAGKDKAKQRELISGNESDTNGVLLYPDGEPRFRLIYVNGGLATTHGKSLGSGRKTLRRFYRNGGSYCGSCAGSFLSCRNVDSSEKRRYGYLHIFPFNTRNTGMKKERVGHFIPPDSALLRYRQFGEDSYVDDIYHNNGNWLALKDVQEKMRRVEVLATYDTPEKRPHQGAAIWAYKQGPESGRILNIGSHPEKFESGEGRALMEACLAYAVDGVGRIRVKGDLTSGAALAMDKPAEADDPAHAKIGDRQYHHFRFQVAPGVEEVSIAIDGQSGFDLALYLKQGKPAFRSNADFADHSAGASKTLRQTLPPGEWYASVECKTTVDAELNESKSFYKYTGSTAVLNGVAYRIEMTTHGGE